MSQANLSVRVDENDKKKLEEFCEETGLNVSVVINMFIKNVIKEHKLPFEIKVEPFCASDNIEYLEQVVDDINSGKAKFIEHDLLEDEE